MSITIIIPYRNRPEHLEQFMAHGYYAPYVNMLVVEQADDKPFNRAKLINIGFLYDLPQCFIAHDVDMLPVRVDYTITYGVTQLANSNIQKIDYLGGVTMYDYDTFVKSGGYHNDYFHRAEDNEMKFNLNRHGIPVLNRFGQYKELQHTRPSVEFDPQLWQKAQQPRTVPDQLSVCQYEVTEIKSYPTHNHIKVLL